MRIKYTKELLESAVRSSRCWREVVHKLNPSANYCGSESHAKRVAVKYGIDFSHFPGKTWNTGRKFGYKRPIEDYFNGAFIKTNELKKRLIQEGIKQSKCEKCNLDKWRNIPIPLELHHIDHNPKNNRLENLLLVCCNCHSVEHFLFNQKKPKKPRKKYIRPSVGPVRRVYKTIEPNKCIVCGKPAENKYCSYNCSHYGSRKIRRPTKEELEKMIWEKSCLQITKELGLKSSTTIAKWCKQYGISKPGVGYWAKRQTNLTPIG